MNRFADAAEDFSRILARESDNALALVQRGQTYCDLQKYDLALEDLDRAIELAPTMADAWLGRGNVYEKEFQDGKSHRRLRPSHQAAAGQFFRPQQSGRRL
jgi:tetratricopeptide (TPR) repeat protein